MGQAILMMKTISWQGQKSLVANSQRGMFIQQHTLDADALLRQ